MGRGQRSGLFKSEDYQYTPGEMYAMGLDPYKAIPPHMRGSGSSATDLKGGAQAAGNLILDGINYLGERIVIWGGKNESSSTAEQNNQSGKSWFNMDFKSDSTLKDNVETIPNALEKIESLRGVHFTWKDTNQAQIRNIYITQFWGQIQNRTLVLTLNLLVVQGFVKNRSRSLLQNRQP